MPTPDASQFIQMKKYQAINGRGLDTGSPKKTTHLYNWVPSATLSKDFLPSFSNKITSGSKFIPINYNTARKFKTPGIGMSNPGGGGVGTQF
jgi:hypothetical protein